MKVGDAEFGSWIATTFFATVHAVQEVAEQQELSKSHQDCGAGNELIHGHEMLHVWVNVWISVSSRESSNSEEMHRE